MRGKENEMRKKGNRVTREKKRKKEKEKKRKK